MQQVLTQRTTSISDFKRNPNEAVREAEGHAFAVLTNNKPSFYVVPSELMEKFAELLADHQLAALAAERANDGAASVPVSLDDL